MNYKTQWNKLEIYVLIWAKEPSHGASGQSWFEHAGSAVRVSGTVIKEHGELPEMLHCFP